MSSWGQTLPELSPEHRTGPGTAPDCGSWRAGFTRTREEEKERERQLHIQISPGLFFHHVQLSFTVLNLKCCSVWETRKTTRSILIIS